MIDVIVSAGICLFLGLTIGFFLGYLVHKSKLIEESIEVGFTLGYEFGKDCFYNPSAKG